MNLLKFKKNKLFQLINLEYKLKKLRNLRFNLQDKKILLI